MRDSKDPSGYASGHRSHVKLIVSAFVLGGVLLVAAYQQFNGSKRVPDSAIGDRQSQNVSPASERTVFGERPNPANTALPGPGAVPGESGARGRVAASEPSQLESFVSTWRTTLMSGNAAAHAGLYASRVDRFYTKRNVSRQQVRREKEKLLTRYPRFHKYDIRDIQVESANGGRAVVTFRKDWDLRGRGQFAGSERQRLSLKNESGSWKITGEEEIKVYWVRRR